MSLSCSYLPRILINWTKKLALMVTFYSSISSVVKLPFPFVFYFLSSLFSKYPPHIKGRQISCFIDITFSFHKLFNINSWSILKVYYYYSTLSFLPQAKFSHECLMSKEMSKIRKYFHSIVNKYILVVVVVAGGTIFIMFSSSFFPFISNMIVRRTSIEKW